MNEPKDFSYDELLRFSRALLAENTALRAEVKQVEQKERSRCAWVCRYVLRDCATHPRIDDIADAMEDAIRGINVPHGTQEELK